MDRSILAACLLVAAPASAWETYPGRSPWVVPDGGLPYCLEVNAVDAVTPADEQAFRDAVETAAGSWRAPCSGWCSIVSDCGSLSWVPSDGFGPLLDDTNWIVWAQDWDALLVGETVIGFTALWYASDVPRDTDILLNDQYYDWVIGSVMGQVDVQSVLVHELGHSLQLDEYDLGDAGKQAACLIDPYPAVMCSTYSEGTLRRDPTADDLDGLCNLYPVATVTACAGSQDGGDDGGHDDGGEGGDGDAVAGGDGDAMTGGDGDAMAGGDGDATAGDPAEPPRGCSCSGTRGGWMLLAAVLLLGARRRSMRAIAPREPAPGDPRGRA